MRRAAWFVSLALLLGMAAAVPSSSALPRARHGQLTADTTVEWRGNAGIRLATLGKGTLPVESMTLFVRGGTYAFVHMLVDPQPAGCYQNSPWRHCYGFFLSKFPRAGEFIFDNRPGYDHLTNSPRPANIISRHLDLYLMTDGVATLRLRPQGGYRGRSAYAAGGAIRGLAMELPRSCGPACGTTPVSEFAAGGATFDFGRTPGHLVAHSVSKTRPTGGLPDIPGNHPLTTQACYYPNLDQPDAPAAASAHPYGCDLAPSGPHDAKYVTEEALYSLTFGGGAYMSWNVGDQVGKRYIGFWSGQAWHEDGTNTGYGVWFNYGIR